jgi:DNA-binding NarL/FixJ family response regulator
MRCSQDSRLNLCPQARNGHVSVVHVDSNRLFLESLSGNRSVLDEIAFVGWALEIPTAVDLIHRTQPHLVLLAGECFADGGLALLDLPRVRLRQCHLAIFADVLTEPQLEAALTCPTASLLSRRSSLSEFADQLRAAGRGRRCIAHQLQLCISSERRTGRPLVERRRRLQNFSRQQLDLLTLLAQGVRVKDIAERLNLSEKSVESHKYRLMNRLQIHDRVELCRWAIREGLIEA